MIDKEFPVDGSGSADVRFASGRLTLREGAPGKIQVRVDGKTDGLNVELRGSVVTISNDRTGFLGSGGRYQVTLEVPPGCDVSVGVASADVQSKVHLGRLDVRSASGDVHLTSVDDLSVKTASGDLHGSRLGKGSFVSASGDLHIQQVEGKFEASTASGDVYFEEVGNDMTSSTLSGNLTIRNFSGDNLRVKTVSGSTRIGIPAGTAVNLDATSRTGSIRLPEPSQSQAEPTSHANVTASMISGDLTIKRV